MAGRAASKRSSAPQKAPAKRKTTKSAQADGATKAPAKKVAKSKASKKAVPKKAAPSPAERIASLEQELAQAHARIAELERRQGDVINRIDWILDHLRSLLETTERSSSRRRSA